MKKILVSLVLLMFISAQTTTYALTINPGKSIYLTPIQKTTSKNISSGSRLEMKISRNVFVGDVLVFKEGDRAYLNVINSKKAGFIGIPGEFVVAGGKAFDANNNEHNIDFNNVYTGEEKTWPKVCLGCGLFIILAPLVLFGFVKGGQAEINLGQEIEVRLAEKFSM